MEDTAMKDHRAGRTGVPASERSPRKHRARLRLSFEESTSSPARRRQTQGASDPGPQLPLPGCTERALSIDQEQLLRTEWLDELRQTYGRPWAVDATEEPSVVGRPKTFSQPPDVAALAASLAARLQASASKPSVPRRRATVQGGGPACSRSAPRQRSRNTADSSSRQDGALESLGPLSDIPLTPPHSSPAKNSQQRGPDTAAPSAASSGSGPSPTPAFGAADRSSMAPGAAASELSMVEKAVVVGVGLLAYPFMRTPQSSETGDGDARHIKTAPAALQQQQNVNNDAASANLEPTTPAQAGGRPSTVINLAACLANAADEHVCAVTASSTLPQTALDDLDSLAVPVVERSNTPQQPMGGIDSSAVPFTTMPAVLPAEPPMAVGEAPFRRTRSLRDTYGSIPTAAPGRAALGTAVAVASADQAPAAGAAADAADLNGTVCQEAGAPSAQPRDLQDMPSIPAISEAASPARPSSRAAAVAPPSPQHADGWPHVPAPQSPARAAAPEPQLAQRLTQQPGLRRPSMPLPAVLTLLAVVSLLAAGLLAAYDPSSDRLSAHLAAARAQRSWELCCHRASAAGVAAKRHGNAAAAAARQLPGWSARAAADTLDGLQRTAFAACDAALAAPAALVSACRRARVAAAADVLAVLAASQRFGHRLTSAAAAGAATVRQEAAGALRQPRARVQVAIRPLAGKLKQLAAGTRAAATTAVVQLAQDCHTVAASVRQLASRVPFTRLEMAAAIGDMAARTGSGFGAMLAAIDQRAHAAKAWLRQLPHALDSRLWPAVNQEPPPSLWRRIRGRRSTAGATATPPLAPFSKQQHQRQLQQGQQQPPPAADKPKLGINMRRAAEPAPSKPAGSAQPGKTGAAGKDPALKAAAPRSPARATNSKANSSPAAATLSAVPTASSRGPSGTTAARLASPAEPRRSVVGPPAHQHMVQPPLHRAPAAAGAMAAGGDVWLSQRPGPQPTWTGAGAQVSALAILVATMACAIAAALAWMGWLSGRRRQRTAVAADGDSHYTGGDAWTAGPDGLFHGEVVDQDAFESALAAQQPLVDHRRHTLATAQPQRDFRWLRPNRVVEHAAAAGGAGLDYLWLRSRLIVKLSPQAVGRVARSNTMARLGHDTSFRSPMTILRDIEYQHDGPVSGGRAAPPAGAATPAQRRISRRQTLA